MRILQTVAIIALACVAAAQDKVDLARQHKAGAVQKYKLVAKIGGADVEIKGTVEVKTTKAEKEKIEAEFKCSDFSQSQNGSVVESEGPPALTSKIDKYGMPEVLEVANNGAVFVALSVASYIPGKQLAKGEEFKVDWKGKDGRGTMFGKGSITDIKTVDGVKIAVVKYSVSVNPADSQSPADLEVISEFNLADGTLLKSKITGNISEGNIDITVTPVGK